jgi:two-component system, OmpR family, KDP operon response regulator KdpE
MSDALQSSGGAQILVVEDEPKVAAFLSTSLGSQGFRVLLAATGAEALRTAEQYAPDLVLLDLGLPDVEGVAVLVGLRKWSRAPVIVLSARGQDRQKVEALDAGADDYLTKPFSVPELLARIRVALRHASASAVSSGDRVEFGPISIDFGARRVLREGNEVRLTPIEYKLLAVLARHAGKVVTHRQLLQEVWGPHNLEDAQYLRVHMTHLRRKLEGGGDGRRWLKTQAGVGYRLDVE